jgi:hypothetical protein
MPRCGVFQQLLSISLWEGRAVTGRKAGMQVGRRGGGQQSGGCRLLARLGCVQLVRGLLGLRAQAGRCGATHGRCAHVLLVCCVLRSSARPQRPAGRPREDCVRANESVVCRSMYASAAKSPRTSQSWRAFNGGRRGGPRRGCWPASRGIAAGSEGVLVSWLLLSTTAPGLQRAVPGAVGWSPPRQGARAQGS